MKAMAKRVSYGWGVVPVEASVRNLGFRTSLIPKDGSYLLPLKDEVRRKTGVTAGDTIAVVMSLARSPR